MPRGAPYFYYAIYGISDKNDMRYTRDWQTYAYEIRKKEIYSVLR
jgi:hypothetical protein